MSYHNDDWAMLSWQHTAMNHRMWCMWYIYGVNAWLLKVWWHSCARTSTKICTYCTHWGRDKMDAIFQTTFSNALFNENLWYSIKIPLKFVLKGPINNIPTLVQIIAWRRRPGDKPLSGPILVNLLTHLCVSRPQWVLKGFGDAMIASVRPTM